MCGVVAKAKEARGRASHFEKQHNSKSNVVGGRSPTPSLSLPVARMGGAAGGRGRRGGVTDRRRIGERRPNRTSDKALPSSFLRAFFVKWTSCKIFFVVNHVNWICRSMSTLLELLFFTLVYTICTPEMATFLTDASIPSVPSRREEAPTRQSYQLVCPRYQRSLETLRSVHCFVE